jgi:hypothetical protein
MLIGVAPVYIDQAFRFVSGVGPKSLDKLSKDTGIHVADLEKFQDDKKALTPVQCVTVWSTVFGQSTFLEANAQMDALKL